MFKSATGSKILLHSSAGNRVWASATTSLNAFVAPFIFPAIILAFSSSIFLSAPPISDKGIELIRCLGVKSAVAVSSGAPPSCLILASIV